MVQYMQTAEIVFIDLEVRPTSEKVMDESYFNSLNGNRRKV